MNRSTAVTAFTDRLTAQCDKYGENDPEIDGLAEAFASCVSHMSEESRQKLLKHPDFIKCGAESLDEARSHIADSSSGNDDEIETLKEVLNAAVDCMSDDELTAAVKAKIFA